MSPTLEEATLTVGDRQLLEAVGRFAINFCRLDGDLQSLTWYLVKPEGDPGYVGYSITTNQTFGQVLRLCDRLIRRSGLPTPVREQWRGLHADLERANKMRNDLLHGIWLGTRGNDSRHLLRIRDGQIHLSEVNAAEVSELTQTVDDAARRLIGFALAVERVPRRST